MKTPRMREQPMIGNDKLTGMTQEQIASVPGMAHFSGTGPKGTFCLGCKFMDDHGSYRYCKKYEELMKGVMGFKPKNVYGNPRSCKYFQIIPPKESEPKNETSSHTRPPSGAPPNKSGKSRVKMGEKS